MTGLDFTYAGMLDGGDFDRAVFDYSLRPALLVHNGIAYYAIMSVRVSPTTGYTSGSFEISLPNPGGMYNSIFTANDDLLILMTSPLTHISYSVLRGYVDKVNNKKNDKNQTLVISGLDYTGKLTLRNSYDTYTAKEISEIIKNPITGLMRYFPDITTHNVQVTTEPVKTVSYLDKPVFDGIKELATEADYVFFVDADKDLHFVPRGYTSSGLTYSTARGNVRKYDFNYDGKKIYTAVKVYGGYELVTSYVNNAVGDASTKAFPTSYKVAQNTMVCTVGAAPKVEGTDYVIDYNTHTVSFVTAPGAAAAIVMTYTAMRQYTALKTRNVSQFGYRELIVTDDQIKTNTRADEIAELNLDLYSDTRTVGKVTILAEPALTVGTTVRLTIADYDVDADYVIMEATHSLDVSGFTTDLTLANNTIASVPELLRKIQADLDEIRKREYNRESSTVVPQSDSETGAGTAVQTITSAPRGTKFTLGVSALAGTDTLGGAVVYDTTYESGTSA